MNKSGNRRGLNRNKAGSLANLRKQTNKTKITKALKQTATYNKQITPEMRDYIRQELFSTDENGMSFLHAFVKSFLDEARRDPNSKCGTMLASGMFNETTLSKLDADVDKAMARETEFTLYRLRSTLYDKQQAVFDNKADKTMLMIAGRRWGKTELMARMLVRDAVKKSHHSLYLNRNFDNALAQMWTPVCDLLDMLSIPYSPSRGNGTITLSCGSDIRFGGASNTVDIDKYRGFKFSFIGIDEVGHLKGLKYLYDEVLQPSTIDYEDSQIFMIGTPPRTKNYAYQMAHNANIRQYHGTLFDNPYIPSKDGLLERIAEQHGTTVDSSFIRREYMGDIEAFDSEALVFKGYKTYDEVPRRSWTHAYVGVDWGFEDEAAVITTVVDDRTKELWVVDCWTASHKPVSEICKEAKAQYDRLRELYPCSRVPWVIVDTNNKEGAYELMQTYKVPNVFCAYKYDKHLAIEQLAEWMRTGHIWIKKGSKLVEDCDNTLWRRDDESDKVLHELDEDAYHGNAIMALLYVSRQFDFDVMGTNHVKSAKEIIDEYEENNAPWLR